jgi:hypothetical protein
VNFKITAGKVTLKIIFEIITPSSSFKIFTDLRKYPRAMINSEIKKVELISAIINKVNKLSDNNQNKAP